MDPITALIAVVGLLSAWIVNYLSDTLPATRSLSKPVCPACGEIRPWMDFSLARPCRDCGVRSGRYRYWAVTTAGIAASVYLWLFPSDRISFAWAWPFVVYLGLVAVIDIEHRVILNEVSLVGVFIGLAVGIHLHGIWRTLIGGLAGFVIMFGLYYLGDLFGKWLARRRGETSEEVALGFGDVNLMGIVGLVLGWPGILMGIMAAILLGGAFSLIIVLIQMVIRRYTPFMAIPYAPFIILGTIILLFH